MKLQFFLHAGNTEIGGFGISAQYDPLYIEDFQTVKQLTSCAHVEFDDAAVADYLDDCADKGIEPRRCMRVWIHTHPGDSPNPSGTDEDTFQRAFGGCDWSLMFIIGRTAQTYCRLAFNAGPGAQVMIPVAVDWPRWPRMVAHVDIDYPKMMAAWVEEYVRNIHPVDDMLPPRSLPQSKDPSPRQTSLEIGWDRDTEDDYGWEEEIGARYEAGEEVFV